MEGFCVYMIAATGPAGPGSCSPSLLFALNGSDAVSVISTDTNRASDITGLPGDVTRAAGNPNTGVLWMAGQGSVYAFYPQTEEVLFSVPVQASYLAVDPCRNRVYASDGGGEVTVIDGAGGTVIGTISGFQAAGELLFDLCKNRLYVSGATEVAVADGASGSIIARVDMEAPSHLALNPVTQRLYIVSGMSSIFPVDTATLEVFDHLENTPFDRIWSLLVNPGTNMLYATGTYGGGVRVYSGNDGQVVGNIALNATKSALDTQTNRVYFLVGDTVAAVNGSTNEVTRMIGGLQEGLTDIAMLGGCPAPCPCPCPPAVGACAEEPFAYALRSGDIAVIDTAARELAGQVPLPSVNGVYGLTANPNAGELYTASDNRILFVDARTGAASGKTFGSSIMGIVFNPLTNKIYVTTISDGAIVLDGTTHDELNVIPGFHPGLVTDTATGLSYFPNQASGVDVIDGQTDTVIGTIEFPADVGTLAVDPVRHLLYGLDGGDHEVYVADTTNGAILTSFEVSEYTSVMAANPVAGELYSVYCDGYYCYAQKNSADGSYRGTQMIGEGIAGFTLDPATGRMIFYDGENQRTVVYQAAHGDPFGEHFAIDMGPVYGYAFMKTLVCPPELVGPTGPPGPAGRRCNPQAYFTTNADQVYSYDPATQASRQVGQFYGVQDVAVDNQGDRLLFIAGRSVYAMDPQYGGYAILSASGTSGNARQFTYNPLSNRVYVTDNLADLGVADVAAKSLVRTITLGNGMPPFPRKPVFDRATGSVYVPVTNNDYILIYSGDGVDDVVSANGAPVSVAVDPARRRMYATTGGGAPELLAYGTGSGRPVFENSVNVLAAGDLYAAADPVTGLIYVANAAEGPGPSGNTAIYEYDGNDIVPVGAIAQSAPDVRGLALDPVHGLLYEVMGDGSVDLLNVDERTNLGPIPGVSGAVSFALSECPGGGAVRPAQPPQKTGIAIAGAANGRCGGCGC